jgi:hypothetical protein
MSKSTGTQQRRWTLQPLYVLSIINPENKGRLSKGEDKMNHNLVPVDEFRKNFLTRRVLASGLAGRGFA